MDVRVRPENWGGGRVVGLVGGGCWVGGGGGGMEEGGRGTKLEVKPILGVLD